MNNNELLAKIRTELEKMPSKARRVAEFILANPSELAFLSIGDVADRLAVSKAQLVRVARMLGFSGYSGLKDAVKETVMHQMSPHSFADEEVLSLEHANIDKTAANLSAENLKNFCHQVKNAASIYCVGWGISALIAENLYTRLLELGLSTVLMKRGSTALIEQVRAVKPKDLVVVCELPSYVIEVTECIKYAHEKGAGVITITDSLAAPVCRFADINLLVSDATKTFGSSIVSAIFLIHLLTSSLAAKHDKGVKEALKAQADGLKDNRVYHPAFGLKY